MIPPAESEPEDSPLHFISSASERHQKKKNRGQLQCQILHRQAENAPSASALSSRSTGKGSDVREVE